MANNITMRQLNNGAYDNLYPKTTASKTNLTTETSALYNLQNGTTEQAIEAIMRVIALSGNVQLKIVDGNGNPVIGATVQGLVGEPVSDANGNVQGIYQDNPVMVVSPYVDLQNASVDISNYIGSVNVLTVTLSNKAEGAVTRYQGSTRVKFSKMVKTVDVCCVGGGAGGSGHSLVSSSYNFEPGGGGGGGGIVNSYGITVEPETYYQINIGAGGAGGSNWGYGEDGGNTTFLAVTANGGKKVTTYKSDSGTTYVIGGEPGAEGCGHGGGNYNEQSRDNTTVSEFSDGATFYSGGGGAGMWSEDTSRTNGGSPNGASGATAYVSNINTGTSRNATAAGIGGGGGGAAWASRPNSELTRTGNSSAGGSGLVAIRVHF